MSKPQEKSHAKKGIEISKICMSEIWNRSKSTFALSKAHICLLPEYSLNFTTWKDCVFLFPNITPALQKSLQIRQKFGLICQFYVYGWKQMNSLNIGSHVGVGMKRFSADWSINDQTIGH